MSLCDPMDCSPPGSSVHRSLQARVLEWAAVSLLQVQSMTGNKMDNLTGSRRLTPRPFFPSQKRVRPPSLFLESLQPQSCISRGESSNYREERRRMGGREKRRVIRSHYLRSTAPNLFPETQGANNLSTGEECEALRGKRGCPQV